VRLTAQRPAAGSFGVLVSDAILAEIDAMKIKNSLHAEIKMAANHFGAAHR
jgi:hypothetical protein